ncbi:immunoglobulin variable region used by the ITC63B heavy chain [Fusarium albosuccineum]|uniref:Immunoglobulin variable region used by the ITC63B heavy chain n=1 Tax=Fusarium albosuccineum TaxID=1237068 RepID=A0A8H4PEZ8_9HYPO|nr:immunoglobulin variable region used by the ITC63B heavy chain [Fusarium albosuccineum]
MGRDPLRPDNDTYKSVYEKAYLTWWALWQRASTDSEFPSSCLEFEHIFPHHPYFPMGLDLDPSGLLTATSTWKPTSGRCDMPDFEQRFQVTPSVGKPTTILTTNLNAPLQKQFGNGDNHITVLVLAWAYALSARWASIISNAAPPEYTTSQAKWAGSHHTSKAEVPAVVRLGSISDEAARWWAAILAPGQGWEASIPHKQYRLLSPWAVSLDETTPILLSSASRTIPPASKTCPSFEGAVQYITEYSTLHAASDQNRAAFATALLLPLANSDGRKVRLPLPRMLLDRPPGTMPGGPIWGQDLCQFDRLLTLSCNPQGIKSILSSIFYEPDVPSNVCGAWLQGTFASLRSRLSQDVDVLARMFFLRSPHLSFLWLGAVITGVYKSFLKSPRELLGTEEIDLHEAAWTRTAVSFIQEPVSCLARDANSIARADEWRLAYLSQGLSEYKFPPLYPYPPPGCTALEDLDIDVRFHATCPDDHKLRCSKISWNCIGGRREVQEIVDQDMLYPKRISSLPLKHTPVEINYNYLDREKELSGLVTRTVFNWMRGADGFPIAERDIYKHEWLDDFNSDDEGTYEQGGGSSAAGSNALVRGWSLKSLTTRCNSL